MLHSTQLYLEFDWDLEVDHGNGKDASKPKTRIKLLSLSSGMVKIFMLFFYVFTFISLIYLFHSFYIILIFFYHIMHHDFNFFFLLFLLGCDKNHNSKFTWDQIRDPQKNCASGSEGNGSWVLYESLKAFYFLPFLWIPISTGEILISILKHMWSLILY